LQTTFFEAVAALAPGAALVFFFALVIAFGFEFINGFHDTANAVTTVIYTHTLKPTPAVVYSGVMNFFGVLLGGTAVAFGIVHLLPVDILLNANSTTALAMTLSLLLAGVIWNLGTWYFGLPVSSSHTLIGSILGVALTNSIISFGDTRGVNWQKAQEVFVSLLISPIIGFVAAFLLLKAMKLLIPNPRLYMEPKDKNPPGWIRAILLFTCGAVSFAHGSNDGQKGMGLILLILIGFLPGYYALDVNHPTHVAEALTSVTEIRANFESNGVRLTEEANRDFKLIAEELEGKATFSEISPEARWEVRGALYRLSEDVHQLEVPDSVRKMNSGAAKTLRGTVEFVPLWVVIGVALALGLGTMIGYERIVITVAEKIGKTHLTYGQGAAAETVAASTIQLANVLALPVSTTHVLSSGVAGTMVANGSGVQGGTIRKIGLAWVMTLPASMALSSGIYLLARRLPIF
jgi:phosphate/sulfate permease